MILIRDTGNSPFFSTFCHITAKLIYYNYIITTIEVAMPINNIKQTFAFHTLGLS